MIGMKLDVTDRRTLIRMVALLAAVRSLSDQASTSRITERALLFAEFLWEDE